MIRPAMQNCLQLFNRLIPATSRVFDHFRSGLWIVILAGFIASTGCTSAVDEKQRAWMNTVFKPYVPDVVQGNFISSEQYAKLQLGQSREQVRQILGTPLLASYFHANRWDYIFEFKRAGQPIAKERRVTVFFDGDKLVKFQGDPLPTEVEMVAEIDGYAKSKRSFWDVITGSNKPPVTPPLQQPELLVPSPTDNLPAGKAVPAAPASSSFWDFFSFSKKSPEAQPAPQQLGPGALNVPQASEVK
ncbi:MAG TPA: outer membrane protein assembly factor BamE [Polynucleobacter sp.]|nr:outer membrane protein assembly factor BamE [Polynucleobacter sp.]